MKILEIDEQTEQQLIAIFDIALKHSGMQVVRMVNEVSSKIREKPEEKVEKKNDLPV